MSAPIRRRPARQSLVEAIIEDSGELLALASAEQLRGLADDDLWQSNADGVDSFDARPPA